MKKKLKLPIKTYLFYLILVALLVTGASYSRYTVTINGYDSISVEKNEFTVTGDEGETLVFDSDYSAVIVFDESNIEPGQTIELPVTVAHNGAYLNDFNIEISISRDGFMPLTFTLVEDWTEAEITPEDDAILTSVYTLDREALSYAFTLVVNWDSMLGESGEGASVTVTITVHRPPVMA